MNFERLSNGNTKIKVTLAISNIVIVKIQQGAEFDIHPFILIAGNSSDRAFT